MTIKIKQIEQFPNINGKVLEAYRVLKRFRDADARNTWKTKRRECWKATGEDEMWTAGEKAELKKHKQVALVVNKMKKGVQGSSAIITDSKPEVKFHPIGSGDLYVAELLKRAHDLVWAKNNGSDQSYNLVEECKTGGIDFFRAFYDYSKGTFGRQVFRAIKDPAIVYWDQDAEEDDLSDSHLIIAQKRTARYIRDYYGNIPNSELHFIPSATEGPDEEVNKSTGVEGADNYAVAESTGKNEGPGDIDPNIKDIWEIEAFMLRVETEWRATITPLKAPVFTKLVTFDKGQTPQDKEKELLGQEGVLRAKVWRKKIERREKLVIVGSRLISSEMNPQGVDADGEPIMELIPLAHNRTVTSYPTCPSFTALPINREKNKRRSQFIHSVSMDVNSPIVRDDNSRWEGERGTAGSDLVIDKNTTIKPYRLAAGGMNMSLFIALEKTADQDIDDEYDLHDIMRGRVPPGQKEWSGRAVLALQDMGGMMSKPFLRRLESALVKLGKANIVGILDNWTRRQWERLLEPDEMRKPAPGIEAPPDQELSPEDQNEQVAKWEAALDKIRPKNPMEPPGISLLDLDVRVAAGSSLPTNRIARADFALSMADRGVYDTEAVLEYIDDPNKDKIVVRQKARQQAEAQASMAKKR